MKRMLVPALLQLPHPLSASGERDGVRGCDGAYLSSPFMSSRKGQETDRDLDTLGIPRFTEAQTKQKPPAELQGDHGGRYWDRTSDLRRVKTALYRLS